MWDHIQLSLGHLQGRRFHSLHTQTTPSVNHSPLQFNTESNSALLHLIYHQILYNYSHLSLSHCLGHQPLRWRRTGCILKEACLQYSRNQGANTHLQVLGNNVWHACHIKPAISCYCLTVGSPHLYKGSDPNVYFSRHTIFFSLSKNCNPKQ